MTEAAELHRRPGAAVEAVRQPSLLPDPVVAAAVERVEYPFAARFGGPDLGPVLRAIAFDRAVRAWLQVSDHRTVVSLGEGLETEFWRVDDGRVRWLTVDLSEMVALRRDLLPAHPRNQLIASSAFDLGWLDEVAGAGPVCALAQGLLMYFAEPQVHQLLAACAERLPYGQLIFDSIPRRATTGTGHREGPGYRLPPTPWGIDDRDIEGLAAVHPRITEITARGFPPGRGLLLGSSMPNITRLPVIGRRLPLVVTVRFAG